MATRLMHLTHSYNHETRRYEYNLRRLQQPFEKRYIPKQMFRVAEMSLFLNEVMPFDYIQATWDLKEGSWVEAERVMAQGLNSKTVPGFPEELGEFEFFDGTCRDHIKVIFVPKGLNLVHGEIGLHVDLTPKKGKTVFEMAATAMKRLNRLYAPVEFAVFGEIAHEKEDIYQVQLQNGGGSLRGRIIDNNFVDGCSFVSPRGAHLLFGLEEAEHGDGVRVTGCMPGGELKGHAEVIEHLEYDFVFNGLKPEVKYAHFYMSRLSLLHVTADDEGPNMDFQSAINFFTQGGLPLLGNMLEKFFRRVIDACQDPARFRKMMYAVLEKNPDTEWIRARAAALGLDAVFPGLARSDFKMFEPVLEKTMTSVVPMTGVAVRRYILPSPYLVEPNGDINPNRDRMRGNYVCSAYVPQGPVCIYRQPNGNSNERWMTHCTALPKGMKHMGRGEIIYLGADMIPDALKAMGGGDFDDPVIVVYEPETVAYLATLPVYPPTTALPEEKKVIVVKPNRYMSQIRNRIDPIVWNNRHLMKQIDDAKTSTGIGVIVNAIMMDTLLTVGKPAMLEDLSEQIASIADTEGKGELRNALISAYQWLENRPDYILRDIANDLESRIDRIKMAGGGGMNEDEELIAAMYDDTQVFPWCWTVGGFLGQGRIPQRIAASNPLTAKTQLCRLLKDCQQEIAEVRRVFREMEWLLVKPLPTELLTHYKEQLSDKELRNYVTELRTYWFDDWAEARKNGTTNTSEGMRATYDRLTDSIAEELEDGRYPADVVAVELARRLYRTYYPTAPTDENGETRSFNDGLLWTQPLGMGFLQALENAGLTGRIEVVELDSETRHLRASRLKVKVSNGIVQSHDDGKVLGACPSLEDGVYEMDGGVITVKPLHKALQIDWVIS